MTTPILSADLKTELEKKFQRFREWKNIVVFDEDGEVLVSKYAKGGEPREGEISELVKAFEDEDRTFGIGMTIGGVNYEVHNFDAKLMLVYGRIYNASKYTGEGAALCAVEMESSKRHIFTFITFPLPALTSRAVSQLTSFCHLSFSKL